MDHPLPSLLPAHHLFPMRATRPLALARGAMLLFVIFGSSGGDASGSELNPFFSRVEQPPSKPPPTLTEVRRQIAQGCSDSAGDVRPLADRYDLRWGLVQPTDPALSRNGAAILIANVGYELAREWLQPQLSSSDDATAYAALTLLLSHGARLAAEGRATASYGRDLDRADALGKRVGANPSDLLFWRALHLARNGHRQRALELTRAASEVDASFYNARLLELQLLLQGGAGVGSVRAACAMRSAEVLAASIRLFDLDTCPRHAVLLMNWLRGTVQELDQDPVALIVRAYVSVLLGNTAAYADTVEILRRDGRLPCRSAALARVEELAHALDRPR